MSNLNICVVHGGTSHERERSIVYGKKIVKILAVSDLENNNFNVFELHLHPNGSWTMNGNVASPEEILKKSHKVWNCFVGTDGESALLEGLCQKHGVKLLGHSALHTELASHKQDLKNLLSQHKIKSPYGKVIDCKKYSLEKLKEVFQFVGIPAIVKPLKNSGAIGISLVQSFGEMQNAVENLISESQDVLVEKVISGTPVSCFIYSHEGLINVNIKVHGEPLSRDENLQIRNEAIYIYNVLAFTHHLECDFLLIEKKGKKILYLLEVNTHPSLVHTYINDVFKDGVISLSEYVLEKIK